MQQFQAAMQQGIAEAISNLLLYLAEAKFQIDRLTTTRKIKISIVTLF